jgi:hypothetical protein
MMNILYWQLSFVSRLGNLLGKKIFWTVTRTTHPSGAHAFTLYFSEVRVARPLVLCVVFCRSLFVHMSLFIWPLYCLSFFNVRLLITSLVSFGHCIVCPSSMYGFWLPPFGIFILVLSMLTFLLTFVWWICFHIVYKRWCFAGIRTVINSCINGLV